MSKLAIILSHRNQKLWIIETLESIRQQTFQDFTLYIVDNCSDDGSPEVIRDWIAQSGCQVVYHQNEIDLFMGAGLNIGHTLALPSNPTFMTYITGDNPHYPTCFEVLVQELETVGSDFVYSAFDYIQDASGSQGLGRGIGSTVPYTTGHFLIRWASTGPCLCYRKEVYTKTGPFREGQYYIMDLEWQLRVEHLGFKIHNVPQKVLGSVRHHAKRVMRVHQAEIREQEKALKCELKRK